MMTLEDLAAICKPHDDRLIAEGRAERLAAALVKIADALRDEIDGAEETRGRDARLSHIIGMCDAALR